MRIIAGIAGGVSIDAPPGRQTRPTTDRVREALFNIISGDLYGSRFLDLFAGTGAAGLEALSRGAVEAVFVDNSRECAAVISKNAEKTRLIAKTRILSMEAGAAIKRLSDEGAAFDIIFIDPPYGKGLAQRALAGIADAGLLAPGGMVVVERGDSDIKLVSEPCAGFAVRDVRRYGNTALDFIYKV